MATTMGDRDRIREHMPVVCSNNKQFGTVDRVEGEFIKLTKDDRGQHHWIPMSWVTAVDDQVHVDRPGDQAMREWLSMPPMETMPEESPPLPM
ncbi:MAG TPA: DUF2171 domain-containing protein [Thermomicrobiales bacterium]